jgi:uncharacterized delta-60 repeat protein
MACWLLLTALLSAGPKPGDTLWVRNYDGPGNHDDFPTGIMCDPAGNVVVTGYTFSMATDFDFVTLKYDSLGALLWTRTYGSPRNCEDRIWSACTDRFGSIYVTGGSIASELNWDYLTIKYRPDGETCWLRRYDSPFRLEDKARAIAVDDSGNVLVTGWSRSPDGAFDFLTVKYSPSGDTVWTRRLDGPAHRDDHGLAVAVDRLGSVIVAGKSAGADNVPQILAAKYDATGRELWRRTARGTGRSHNWPCAVRTDTSGSILVAGTVSSSSSGYDYWLARYASDGRELWTRTYDGPAHAGDIANALCLSPAGQVFVAGQSMGKQTFYDFATVAFSLTGETLWVRREDGPVHGDDRAQALALDKAGNCYVVGSSVQARPFESFLVAGYGPKGDTLWQECFPESPVGNSRAVGVTCSGSRVFVTGYAYGPDGHTDIVTVSYRQ